MHIDVHVHHSDPCLNRILEDILLRLNKIEAGISTEDQKLLDALNARAEEKTRRLQAIDNANKPPAV